jgi:transcriptional regulator with XRE-family HTH domain
MSESSLLPVLSSKPKAGTTGNSRSRFSKFGIAARALWPRKTAAELAFRADVSERAAKFWLSGERSPSHEALMAILDEIAPRRRA